MTGSQLSVLNTDTLACSHLLFLYILLDTRGAGLFGQARSVAAVMGFRGGNTSREINTGEFSALAGVLIIVSQFIKLVPYAPADTAVPAAAFAASVAGTVYMCSTRQYTGLAAFTTSTLRAEALYFLILKSIIYSITAWFVIIRPLMNMTMGAMMSATLSAFWMSQLGALITGKSILSVTAACLLSLSIVFSKFFTVIVQTYFLCMFGNTLAHYKDKQPIRTKPGASSNGRTPGFEPGCASSILAALNNDSIRKIYRRRPGRRGIGKRCACHRDHLCRSPIRNGQSTVAVRWTNRPGLLGLRTLRGDGATYPTPGHLDFVYLGGQELQPTENIVGGGGNRTQRLRFMRQPFYH
jgi:hypothetical protein